jgi:NagD protein
MEAGLHTVLVYTGITRPEDVTAFPFRPNQTLKSVADLLPQL